MSHVLLGARVWQFLKPTCLACGGRIQFRRSFRYKELSLLLPIHLWASVRPPLVPTRGVPNEAVPDAFPHFYLETLVRARGRCFKRYKIVAITMR